MKFNLFFEPVNYVYALFLFIGFLGIIYFEDFNTAFFLFLFLLMFTVTIYSLVGIYKILRGFKEKLLVWKLITSALLGIIIFYQYGFYALQRVISFSAIIGLVVVLYVGYFNKTKH